jgi:hypothetical protein
MSQTQKSPEVLSRWHYEPDLWRDFLEYESGIYKGSVKAAKHMFFVVLSLTMAVVFPTLFITLLVTDRWDLDMLGPTFAFAVFGWFALILAGMFWLYRRERWRRLNEQTGEVVISHDGVKTNGLSFNWDSGGLGLAVNKVERKSVSVRPGRYFEILEFHTVNYFRNTEGGRAWANSEWRVPIPLGKEAEAERIISHLQTRLLSAEQQWIKENFALGHDFSLGTCRKCGETIAESASYPNHRCKG